jgi:hypothetical protein
MPEASPEVAQVEGDREGSTGRNNVDSGSSTHRLSVTEICQQFETAFKTGQQPRIEDYLGQRPEPHRSVLLCHLLILELAHRINNREKPSVQEYRRRFPDHLSVVDGVLRARGREVSA